MHSDGVMSVSVLSINTIPEWKAMENSKRKMGSDSKVAVWYVQTLFIKEGCI